MKFFADFYRVSGIPILWLTRFTKDVLYLLSHSSILSFPPISNVSQATLISALVRLTKQ